MCVAPSTFLHQLFTDILFCNSPRKIKSCKSTNFPETVRHSHLVQRLDRVVAIHMVKEGRRVAVDRGEGGAVDEEVREDLVKQGIGRGRTRIKQAGQIIIGREGMTGRWLEAGRSLVLHEDS